MPFLSFYYTNHVFTFQITDYYTNDTSKSPLLVIGTAGAGKSALMAKCAADARHKAENGLLTIPE